MYHERMFIKVLVTPGARKETVSQMDESLVISVREPAEGNRANTRVREIIALRHKVPLTKVRILTGHHSRSKMVSISS